MQGKWKAVFPAVLGALLTLGIAVGAHAQGGSADYRLESVQVTAQKRAENVQDVPMSMGVVTGEQMEEKGIDDSLELMRLMPNVMFRRNSVENTLSIRGMMPADNSMYGPAGFYVDDVSYSIPYIRDIQLMDVERVEVLRGPQGTLYGRNAEAGVVNIVTRRPGNDKRAKITMGLGNNHAYQVQGAVSGPLKEDVLAAGLAFRLDDTNGHMTNDHTGADDAAANGNQSGRVAFRLTPTDDWDIDFTANMSEHDGAMGYYRFLTGPYKTESGKLLWDGPNTDKRHANGQNVRAVYHADGFDVTSISAHNYADRNWSGDADLTPVEMGGSDMRYRDALISQELRVSSTGIGPLEWLGGVHGFTETIRVSQEFDRFPGRSTRVDTTSAAAFGQLTYTLFDDLHLTGGLRLDHQDMKGKTQLEYNGETRFLDSDLTFDEWLPKASVSYDWTDDVMTYATVARGYLAGGFNYAFGRDDEEFTYQPEYVMSYEVGAKTSWFANKMLVNLALFHMTVDDKQVAVWRPGVHPDNKTYENAADAYSQGAELDVTVRPCQGLDLFASLGYLNARVDEWVGDEPGGGTYDYGNKRLPYASEWSYSLGGRYSFESGFFVGADLSGTTEYYAEAKNEVKVDGATVVNARAGWEDEHWTLTVWSDNLFDKEYAVNKFNWAGNTLVQDGESRTFGATVSYKF